MSKSYAIFACLFGACTPCFTVGCAAFGELSPDARNALAAAGRIAEKTEPCLRALLAEDQGKCVGTEAEVAECKGRAASKFVADQKDRDEVKDFACAHSDEVIFAGECEAGKAP